MQVPEHRKLDQNSPISVLWTGLEPIYGLKAYQTENKHPAYTLLECDTLKITSLILQHGIISVLVCYCVTLALVLRP